MPPTVQEIKDAVKLGVDFFRQTVADVAFPAAEGTPIDDADPVFTGEKVLTHNTGGAFYGIVSEHPGNLKVGSYHDIGPGNKPYYGIKVREPVRFLFTNDTTVCRYQTTTKDEDSIYKIEMDCTFMEPPGGIEVARYILAVWYYYDETPRRFKFWAQRQWAKDPWRGLGWSSYQLVDDLTPGSPANLGDGGSVDVWEDTITVDTVNKSPALMEFPTKLQRSAAYFFGEMADYYEDQDLQDLADGIWKWVSRWTDDPQFNCMYYDFLDIFWEKLPPSNWPQGWSGLGELYAEWCNDDRMWWDPALYKELNDTDILGLTVYQSHLISTLRLVFYLQGVWRWLSKMPYCLSAQFALVRSEIDGGNPEMVEKAYQILKKCNWTGHGVRISLADQITLAGPIIMAAAAAVAGFAATLGAVVGLIPLGATALAAAVAAAVEGYREYSEDIPRLWDEFLHRPESYHGIWFGTFFCAAVKLYEQANSLGMTDIKDWAQTVAGECADVALKIQLPKSGEFYHWEDPNVRYCAHEAGGFLSSYDINTEEGRGEFRADPEFLTDIFETVGRRWEEYTQQGPWAGGAGTAFETTMLSLKGLKLYKELILGDYT